MKGVDKVNARYAVLIGEDELANETVWVKDLESKEERSVKLEDF
jgi:histidyl-tRNA synthetase